MFGKSKKMMKEICIWREGERRICMLRLSGPLRQKDVFAYDVEFVLVQERYIVRF